MTTRLEELCRGCDTVIHFTVSAVTMTVFDFDGEVNVLHIRTLTCYSLFVKPLSTQVLFETLIFCDCVC